MASSLAAAWFGGSNLAVTEVILKRAGPSDFSVDSPFLFVTV